MDNGRIVAQGTPSHVASVWPELNQTSQNDPEVETEPGPNRTAGESQAKNHWNKLRLVTKTGYLFKSAARERTHSIIDPEVRSNQRWKRLSSRLNSLSLQMSHDLLLFMDESIAEQYEPGSPFDRQRARSISTRTSSFVRIRRRLRSLTTSVTADEPLANHRRFPGSKQRNSFVTLSLQPVVSTHPSGASSPQCSTSPDDEGTTKRKFTVDIDARYTINFNFSFVSVCVNLKRCYYLTDQIPLGCSAWFQPFRASPSTSTTMKVKLVTSPLLQNRGFYYHTSAICRS